MTVPRTALSPLVATAKSLAIDAVVRELVPTPSFVRMWFPQVSRGRAAAAGTGVRADPS